MCWALVVWKGERSMGVQGYVFMIWRRCARASTDVQMNVFACGFARVREKRRESRDLTYCID
jgi:ribosomal protein L37E